MISGMLLWYLVLVGVTSDVIAVVITSKRSDEENSGAYLVRMFVDMFIQPTYL